MRLGHVVICKAHRRLSQLRVYLIAAASVLHLQLRAATPAHGACMSRQMLTKNDLSVYSTLMVAVAAEVRPYRFKTLGKYEQNQLTFGAVITVPV